MNKLLALFPLLLACPKRAPEPAQPSLQEASFEYAWSRIAEVYPYEDMNGLDWQAVHDELLPQAQAATSAAELRPVLEDMIGRLGESHFGVIPAEAFEHSFTTEVIGANATNTGNALDEGGDEPEIEDGEPGELGLELRWVDGQALVFRSRGPALAAGVQPGWVVTAFDGELVSETAAHEDSPDASELGRWLAVQVHGMVGEQITLTVLDGQDQERELSLEVAPMPGVPTQIGHMPPIATTFDAQVLPGQVGLVHFNVFMTTIAAPMQETMTGFVADQVTGVIIDLRGNPGGVAGLGSGLAGYFSTERTSLGTMVTRDSELNFVVYPRPAAQRFEGPVAILVDELSFSTAEILPYGMQSLGRARIFGAQTAGLALPSTVDRLPNEDRLQYVFADLTGPDGQRIEGRGVTPDEPVPLTRQALLSGLDPVQEAARCWVLAETGRSCE